MSQLYYAESGTPLANIETITGNAGGVVGPDAFGNITIRGPNSAYLQGTPASHLQEVYGSASYLVGASNAPYATIQAAVTQAATDGASASSQKMIVVRPGTYTETVTIPCAGIVITCWDSLQIERGLSVNSGARLPAVILQGTLATAFDTKVINLGLFPSSGSPCISVTDFCTVQAVNCKFVPYNTGAFGINNGPLLVCQGCNFTSHTSSSTDALVTTSTSSPVVLAFTDCFVDVSAATTVSNGVYKFYNCGLNTFFNLTSANLTQFIFENCSTDAGTINAFITGGASDTIQIIASNSTLSSDAANLLNFTGASSYIHANSCYLKGNLTTGTATDNIIQACSTWSASISTWVPTNRAFGNAVTSYVQNTGTASAQAHKVVESGGGDPSSHWTINGGNTFCVGIDNSDSDAWKATYSSSGGTSPSTGTTLWRTDTTTNVTLYATPLISPGGVVMNALIAATPTTVTTAQRYIPVDTSALSITIKLPNQPDNGTQFVVKDATGTAATRNITVQSVSGLVQFDSAFSDVINANWGVRTYTFCNASVGYLIT